MAIREKWPGTMTDRERFRNQMSGKSVDRCFNMEFGYWDENFREWAMFRDNGIADNVAADEALGFDTTFELGGNVWTSPPIEERILEVKADTIVKIDPDGVKVEVPKDGHATIPRCIGPTVVTPDDWRRVKERHFDRSSAERRIPVELLAEVHHGRDYPLGVSCGSMIGKIRDMLTFEGLAYACCDYPDMVEDMVETSCLLVEDWLDQVLPAIDFDYASGWEDICFRNGPIVSVPFFRDVVMPRYKRLRRKLDAHGIDLWWIDCDGDVRPILPYLLEGGVNCLFPFEVNSAGHPAELMARYDGRLRIMGGFDKMALIAGKEAIRGYMKGLEPLVAKGGYIPFCDHRCPPDVREENYLYYLDLKRETFG